jgi:hypothetical protein
MEIILGGPSRWIKKTEEFRKNAKSDIIRAEIRLGKVMRELHENHLTLAINHHPILFISHRFRGINGYLGRWYNANFSRDHIKNNVLTMTIKDWEDEDTGKIGKAIVTIIFSDQGVAKITKLLLKIKP